MSLHKKPLAQRIKLGVLSLVAVFALSLGITGGLMVETESDVSAAAPKSCNVDGSECLKPSATKTKAPSTKKPAAKKKVASSTKKKTKKKKVKCSKSQKKKGGKCVAKKKKSKVKCAYGKTAKGTCKAAPNRKRVYPTASKARTDSRLQAIRSAEQKAAARKSASGADGIGAGAGSAGSR